MWRTLTDLEQPFRHSEPGEFLQIWRQSKYTRRGQKRKEQNVVGNLSWMAENDTFWLNFFSSPTSNRITLRNCLTFDLRLALLPLKSLTPPPPPQSDQPPKSSRCCCQSNVQPDRLKPRPMRRSEPNRRGDISKNQDTNELTKKIAAAIFSVSTRKGSAKPSFGPFLVTSIPIPIDGATSASFFLSFILLLSLFHSFFPSLTQ